MAKPNKKGKHKGHHKGGHRKNPKENRRRRRRRNPEGTFTQRLMSLAGGAAVALGAGVLVTVGQAKFSPGSAFTLYGLPIAGLAAGAWLSEKMPTVGTGLALGSVSPFVLPVASKLLSAPGGVTSKAGTQAVEIGDEFYHALSAVEESLGDAFTGAQAYGDYRHAMAAVEEMNGGESFVPHGYYQ